MKWWGWWRGWRPFFFPSSSYFCLVTMISIDLISYLLSWSYHDLRRVPRFLISTIILAALAAAMLFRLGNYIPWLVIIIMMVKVMMMRSWLDRTWTRTECWACVVASIPRSGVDISLIFAAIFVDIIASKNINFILLLSFFSALFTLVFS